MSFHKTGKAPITAPDVKLPDPPPGQEQKKEAKEGCGCGCDKKCDKHPK